jgi:RHS repeat-associated protein
MKTLSLLLLLAFCFSFSFSQQNGNLDLNSNLLFQDYTARDQINSLPGTIAKPLHSGQGVHLFIDKSIQLDAEYENAANFYSQPQPIDQSKAVGSIKGQVSVSLTGQSTYSIPILVPPGTKNFVPSISIAYNSVLSDGIVGRGWNISGVSAITRVPKDIFHDCEKKAISLDDNNDVYALDGVRIIGHKLENDNFSYINYVTSLDPQDNYFKVETKEGLTMEYGSSDDSKLMLTNANNNIVPFAWYLKKITDKFGNFITYEYYNQNNEITVKEINFTGNQAANISPCNSIKFYYDIRADKTTRYFLGNSLLSSLILREIKVTVENSFTRMYKFLYGFNSQTYLKEVVEIGSKYSELNSTVFSYGDVIPVSKSAATSAHNITSPSTFMVSPIPTNVDYRSGDFNGDGITDLVGFEFNSLLNDGQRDYNGTWKMHLSVTNPNYSHIEITPTAPLPADFNPYNYNDWSSEAIPVQVGMQSADFNLDGLDDIVIASANSGPTMFTVYYSTGNDFSIIGSHSLVLSHALNQVVLADVDGDGRLEGIEYTSGLTSSPFFKIFWFETGQSVTIFNTSILDVAGSNVPLGQNYLGFNAIDFDGDGIHELMTTRNQKLTFIKFSLSTFKSREVYVEPNILSNGPHNYFGDFNGDGIIDNIKVPQRISGNNSATVRFGTGTGFTTSDAIYGTNKASNDIKYLIADINNNSKTDLLKLVKSTSNSKTDVFVYYDCKLDEAPLLIATFTNTVFPDIIDPNDSDPIFNPYFPDFNTDPNKEPEFIVNDFNGDGISDVFFKSNYSSTRQIIFFNPESTSHLLTSISDGFRKTTAIEYNTLAKGGTSLYEKGTSSVFPVVDVQPALYVVKQISADNGIGGTTSLNYKYFNASVHLQGKGFLGFDKIVTTNNTTQLKEENEFVLNTTYYEKTPISKSVFLLPNITTPIFKEEYSNSFTVTSNFGDCYYIDNPTQQPTTSPRAQSHFTKIDDVISHDYITGKVVLKHNDYGSGDDLGNILFSRTEIVGVEVVEISTTYDHVATYGTINNVPTSVVTTKTRQPNAAFSRRTDYQYYPLTGGIWKIIQDPSTTNQITTEYQYHITGQIIHKEVTSSGLPTITSDYDYDHPNYRFRTKDFNSLGQLTETTYDSKFGVPTSVKGADGLTTRFIYDDFGRLKKSITPDNNFSTTEYHWVTPGNLPGNDHLNVSSLATYYVINEKPGSPTLVTYYDALGRELQTEIDGKSGKIYKQSKYDSRGNLWKETSSYSISSTPVISTFVYDDVQGPNLLRETISTDGNNTNITQFDYSFNAGSSRIETTPPDGNIVSKTTDASGKLIQAEDNGGVIDYSYFSNDQIKEIKVNGNTNASMTYDNFGFQETLDDKDAGIITYDYNAYGQLISQTDARSNTYHFEYDVMGRCTLKTGPEGNYTYSYVLTGNNGINQIEQISGPNNISYSYTYDGLQRVTSYTENINGLNLTSSYEYDAFSNVSKTTYPGDFSISNEYDAKGYLRLIKNNNNEIWRGDEMNAFGQYSKYTLHPLNNPIQTQIAFNNFGYPEKIAASGIQDLRLDFDIANGNLKSRTDAIRNLSESFMPYDDQNRLELVNGPSPMTIVYDPNDGTIEEKSDAGTYTLYDPNHLGTVKQVTQLSNSAISHDIQVITYTPFNKIETIEEGDYLLELIYGPDQQRKKTELSDPNGIINLKYFYPGYEKNISGSITQEIYYINAPTGLCAMYVVENGVGNMYYVYNDHLGSILKLTDANGVSIAEQNFDAWGRNRNPNDWTYTGVPSIRSWLYRGYTGHEHLPKFDLINMNGRCYDPILGMMLSPDNFVQQSDNTQNFNRYAYCLNNPLKYSDPSGDFIFTALLPGIGMFIDAALWGAVIGGAGYTASVAFSNGGFNSWNNGQFWKSVSIGAISGIVTAGIGSAYGAAGSNGLGGEVARAYTHGLSNGIISELSGGDFMQGFASGSLGSLAGSGFLWYGSDFATSTLGTYTFSGLAGGTGALLTGGDFWQGASIGIMTAGLNHLQQGVTYSIKSGDRELNPNEYVLKNGKVRSGVKDLYDGLVDEMKTEDFDYQVTGGDRYVGKDGKVYSSTDNSMFKKGSGKAHIRGDAVDLRIKYYNGSIVPLKIVKPVVINRTQFIFDQNALPNSYPDLHYHLQLPKK